MKSVLLVTLAGLAAAQNLSGEPACAVPCLSTAIASVCTPASDQACACASQSAIGDAAVSCLLASCNSTDLISAQSAGTALCVAFSATASPSATATGASATTTTTTAAGNSTVTSSTASVTSGAGTTTETSTSGSSAGATSGSSSTASAASTSSTAGAGAVQGSAAVGAGLLGLFLAGVVAL